MRIRTGLALLGAAAAAALAVAVPATAAGSTVAGSYDIADLGQGGWGGGPLFADGTIGGSGQYSFNNGADVGKITGTSWSDNHDGTVTLCFTETPSKGTQLLFPSPACFSFPANGKPFVISEGPGERTLIRVRLNG